MTTDTRITATISPRRRRTVLLVHAAVAWALCTATMVIGLAVATEEVAIIAHLVGAPIIATLVALHYFVRFGYTGPLATAATFVSFVVVVDFVLVAMVIMRSLEMFASPPGTWIPFGLIFLATYVTGREVERRRVGRLVASPSHGGKGRELAQLHS